MHIALPFQRFIAWAFRQSPRVFSLVVPQNMAAVLRQYRAVAQAPSFATREAYFVHLATIHQANSYWEFGVHQGASVRLALDHFSTVREIHGFDSFEGLPTDWTHGSGTTFAKGHFDVGGQVPDIQDPSVHFHKGWFEEVLPDFLTKNTARGSDLVVHFDADLFEPTAYVLDKLGNRLLGSLLMFDEWTGGEARALEAWLRAQGYRMEFVAWVPNINHGLPVQVAGRCVQA